MGLFVYSLCMPTYPYFSLFTIYSTDVVLVLSESSKHISDHSSHYHLSRVGDVWGREEHVHHQFLKLGD